jgi:RNA polymerase sigma-70 factor (ECF subfamily)
MLLSRERFAGIVDAYSAELTRYALRRMRSLSLAQDVVQEVFLRLAKTDFRKIEDHLRPWLFRACRNLSIDHLRRMGRWEFCPGQILEQNQDEASDNPALHADRDEQCGLLRECLHKLPERNREILWLKFSGGLSYQEIGRVMALSESNVGFLLHRSLCQLRAHFQQEVLEP